MAALILAGGGGAAHSLAMPLLRALAALALATRLQITLGQQFHPSVEFNKLPLHKNPESLTVAKNFDNMVRIQKMRHNNENMKSDTLYNTNKTETKTSDETMTNFLRNQVHGAPATLTVINRNPLAAQFMFGHPIGVPLTSSFESNVKRVTTPTVETITKQNATRTESKSPLQVPVGTQPSGAVSPQILYLTSAQPLLSSLQFAPNTSPSRAIAAPPQSHQETHQTLSSSSIPPTNVEGTFKYMLDVPVPADVLSQRKMDNLVHIRPFPPSFLLSHILAQNYNTPHSTTPVQIRYPSRDAKKLNNKTLLALLLKLLNEKNNSDNNISDKSPTHGMKREHMDDGDEVNSLEMSSESETSERDDARGAGAGAGALDSGVEDDYYSDESSDYGENYDDD